AEPRGLAQSGLGVVKGKQYDGYLYLNGDSGTKVQVSLIWGPGAADRQAVVLPAATGEWRRVPFRFAPTADSTDARLEITGTGNAGMGDENSAAEEIEYLNGAATSEWGAKRAANGHPQPYGVKYWDIGNEPYGWWQIGKTSLDYFMLKHNRFAEAMRRVDPSIVLIGSGAMPDQLHPKDVKENASLESIQHKFGTEEDWTGGLFAKAWGNFAGVTEHWYDRAEERPNAPPDEELIELAQSPSNHVRMEAEEWKIYEQRFPA